MRYLLLILFLNVSFAFSQDLGHELIVAAESGNEKEVYRLLRLGADVNAKTDDEITPLMYAIENQHNKIVELLISKGAYVDLIPINGITALFAAVNSGNLQGAYLLLEAGANTQIINTYKQNPLSVSVQRSDFEMTELLLDYTPYFSRDYLGNSELFYAIQNQDTAIVRLLVERGADVNAKNNSLKTPLMVAASTGNVEIVKYLIDNKADINILDSYNYNALCYAINSENAELVKLLIDKGADANYPIKKNLFPIELAQNKRNKDIISTLKNAGAKQSYIPYINGLGFETGVMFTRGDAFYRMGTSLHDLKYNLQLGFVYATRFGREKIWISKNNLTYNQYREKRRMYILEAQKNINFLKQGQGEFGVYGGVEAIFSTGNYKGLEKRAERLTILSPNGGVYYISKITNLGLKFGYHFLDLHYFKAPKNYYSFSIILKLPM